MTNTTRFKLMTLVMGSLLVAGLAVAYLLRGTEGIAIFVALVLGLAILFAWRTH